MNAVSWYDETAEKVIKNTKKLSGDKLDKLLIHLDCTVEQLPDYGYFPGKKPNEYIIYDQETDLRDNENIPLNEISRRSNEIISSEKSIVLVCEMGSSSSNAGEILKKEGHNNILILKGGINQWRMDNLPLI